MLNLPALLHVIPGAMLHDALLVVGWNVGGYEQVLQLDLACQDVNVLQQILPLPLEAALQVCCLCLLALEAALQLLQLLSLPFDFFLSSSMASDDASVCVDEFCHADLQCCLLLNEAPCSQAQKHASRRDARVSQSDLKGA